MRVSVWEWGTTDSKEVRTVRVLSCPVLLLLSCAVPFSAMWCGLVRCSVVWGGLVWCGVVWCGTA
jgi:hypothetical protein